MTSFDDVLYEKKDGIATITINRPKQMNAFRARTCTELTAAFMDAWGDREIGSVILTGAGDRAFCTGGDLGDRDADGYQGKTRSEVGLDIEDLHSVMRDIPKPVIAAVNGYAIGGGNVLNTICDLSIAAEHARFGQVGPKVGSVDPGFGTAYLTRVIGEKRAREMWFLCERYTAEEAKEMGLVNRVVPSDQLLPAAREWGAKILEMSPTAIKLAKQSMNVMSEQIRAVGSLGISAVTLYYGTEEALEGKAAFEEKRKPNFRKFRK